MEDITAKTSSFFSQWNLSLGSWDFLILFFLVLVTIAYTFLFVTRGKLLPVLVSTYMALVLVEFAPFLNLDLAKRFGLAELFTLKLLAFGMVFLLVMFLLSRVILQSPVGAETFGVLSSAVFALSQTGFLLAVIISFLPGEITGQFSALARTVFVGRDVLFYWAAAPVVLLLALGRKANREVG